MLKCCLSISSPIFFNETNLLTVFVRSFLPSAPRTHSRFLRRFFALLRPQQRGFDSSCLWWTVNLGCHSYLTVEVHADGETPRRLPTEHVAIVPPVMEDFLGLLGGYRQKFPTPWSSMLCRDLIYDIQVIFAKIEQCWMLNVAA
jgi:hypothetical protein